MSTERSQRGMNRVLTKLEHSFETGNYYEAHQMYRTLHFRYTAQHKYEECLELLYNGALKLIGSNQEPSAADLGLLIVDTLEKCDDTIYGIDIDKWIDRLCILIENLLSTTVERDTLINRCVKWSCKTPNNWGHPHIHKRVGELLWSEGDVEQARHHILLCRDGNMSGRFLIKISDKKLLNSEVDLYIVQAVLQQLCLKDYKTAKETFIYYVRQHPYIKRKEFPYKMPLLNFIHFLFLSIESKNSVTFRSLCDIYKPSLDRDSSFQKYLLKIGVIYFGINPPPPDSHGHGHGSGMMGGMFNDLVSRLFQSFEDDDENNGDDNNGHGHGDGTHIIQELD